jgi:hypothetical protein
MALSPIEEVGSLRSKQVNYTLNYLDCVSGNDKRAKGEAWQMVILDGTPSLMLARGPSLCQNITIKA